MLRFLIPLLFAPALTFAATKSYKVSTQVFVAGKLIGTPQLIAVPGKEVSIAQEKNGGPKFTIKLTASDFSNEKIKNAIMLKLNFQVIIDGVSKQGKATFATLPGNQGSIRLGQSGNHPDAELVLTAVRE